MHLSTSLTTPIEAFQANITSDTNIMIHKHNMFKIFKYWEAEGFAILIGNFKSEAYWVDKLSRLLERTFNLEYWGRSAWSFYLPWLRTRVYQQDVNDDYFSWRVFMLDNSGWRLLLQEYFVRLASLMELRSMKPLSATQWGGFLTTNVWMVRFLKSRISFINQWW